MIELAREHHDCHVLRLRHEYPAAITQTRPDQPGVSAVHSDMLDLILLRCLCQAKKISPRWLSCTQLTALQ